MRYVVPYSAPGIKWGQLRIDAESSAEALAQAREIHTRAYRLASNLGWAGPGYRRMFAAAPSRHRLAKRERSQIVYGEPSPGFWLSPSVPASWPASSDVA